MDELTALLTVFKSCKTVTGGFACRGTGLGGDTTRDVGELMRKVARTNIAVWDMT